MTSEQQQQGVSERPPGEPRSRLTRFRTRLRDERPRPLEAAVLWVSGVDRRVLDRVPSERTEFLVQGTGILITTTMAFASGYIASGLAINPPPTHNVRIVIGAGLALVIFLFDRSIVRQVLRPHHFPPDVLNALWNPTADAKWYDILAGGVAMGGRAARISSAWTLPFKVLIRFAFAFVVGFLIADVLVIRMFLPTVDSRASYILEEQKRDRLATIQEDYEAKITALDEQLARSHEQVGQDPNVAELTGRVTSLNERITSLESDIAQLTQFEQAERLGVPGVTYKLSNGAAPAKPTTGVAGCAEECRTAKANLANAEAELRKVVSDRNAAQAALDTVLAGKTGNLTTLIDTINKQKQDLAAQKAIDELAASGLTTVPTGIVIRREALHQLSIDAKPWTQELDLPPPCLGGPAGILCGVWRWIFPPTPIGTWVGSFRVALILLDTSAVLWKILSALRRRRPYDVVMARLEEESIAKAVEDLDEHLDKSGRALERRAAERHGARADTGAALLREVRSMNVRERRRLEREIRRQIRREDGISTAMNLKSRLFRWPKPSEPKANVDPSTNGHHEQREPIRFVPPSGSFNDENTENNGARHRV